MSLAEYRRKRRFDRTREPAPGKGAGQGRAIFVVQLHHARRRHFDFRLQVGDTLKSWAVPKGPSFDPTVKRLAVEVEDHPLDYAGFEGEIPQGEYGGGHVALFDRGIWSSAGDVREQLAKGHLRFELEGQRLHGGWHLIRTGRRSRQPEWLLVKEQDRYAGDLEADDLLEGVTAPPVIVAGRKAVKATKAPRPDKAAKATKAARKSPPVAGASRPSAATRRRWSKRAAAVPGARAAALPDAPFAPQLARLVATAPEGEDWLHEVKWDGYRLLTTINGGRARLWSRNALEWTGKVPEIVAALESLGLDEAALDGELIAGRGAQADFGVLQATLSGERNAPLTYALFDLPHLQGRDLRGAALDARKELLAALLEKPPPHLAYSAHVRGDGGHVLAQVIEQGLEGIVSKRAGAPYRAGRGDDWRKAKQSHSDEFAVVGFTAPKGARAGFGSLLLARPDGDGGWSYAGRVGSGFSDELLRRLTATLERRKPQATPSVRVDVDDPELRRARWTPPSQVVEVYYRGLGNQGLLRQPSLKGLRPDKSIADLQAASAEIMDKLPSPSPSRKHAAATAPARRARASNAADAGSDETDQVELSSPERVVFPDSGITKRDVADYYLTVSEWLLPELRDRPLSVVRCPQGSTRPCFFQKHHTAGLERVDTVSLTEEDGDKADYLVVRDLPGLMELVQFNALEFHPWGSRADAPDLADRIVFDLDPGEGVAWRDVAVAARQIRALLERLELVSFLRTSGGKGLHVVVPLRPACAWERVKPFAHAFADSLARSEPQRYLATATKKFRRGRIFIDYLRNGRGATSVASFSLRARPGAPVAMPIGWQELGKTSGSAAFDIANTPRRLARLKRHPWEGIDALEQGLDRVDELLGEA